MFIILRKSSIRKTLALATFLIIIGLSLRSPYLAQASEFNLYYLYPYPSNNPSQTSLFWSESEPSTGAYNLAMWSEIVPGKQIVIGLPEGYQVNSALLGNNLSKYITTKLGNRFKETGKTTGSKTIPKDTLTYEREITPEGGIKEKIRVEIIDHFKNNDNFEKYMEIIRQNITPNELPEKPVSKDDTTQAVMLFGNTITLAGLALFVKTILPLLL